MKVLLRYSVAIILGTGVILAAARCQKPAKKVVLCHVQDCQMVCDGNP